ncbi:asparagine synthase (glutamine-hydrolyzing) [Noviherbaspirillum saxi]|uniref:asparagine synthase (glutamine-hydrolyzing) n=1 Tax=Noviherbaspirillum saxi TaxID=2320863 RepID=A0A3A3FK56_9BURK|nr:asparagine synthase (glutamine-hydrolyzing) [Noviherbaspirillum saxi]RJF95883.1 asparagine synthase (glutamine-hydrolyzing) [Noviherbaspirillum saxi]
MCGIAGKIINPAIEPEPAATSAAQLRAIRQRGPDSDGSQVIDCYGRRVHLVHSRLSVIDLSDRSQQPMHDPVSGWWLVYNGEIYNYLEVRAELQAQGWSFKSNGDTEVLLKAWAQWGVKALDRLNGMFAFAAFHPDRGELWLVRDRFGVKPLAWGRLPQGGIVFSSSVASVARDIGSEIDTQYCARGVRYKVYETAGAGAPFNDVRTVPAGNWVRFTLSRSDLESCQGQWYDLNASVAAVSQSLMRYSDDEMLQQCRTLLESAVSLRLRSDVPVAVSLSGGLDSSTVASLARRGVEQLHGFTYGSPGAPCSEGPEVRKFSDATGVRVTYVWPDFDKKSLSDALERTLAFQEAPFASLSVVAQNEVYRAVREANFKVLLGGQGGDELFAGYRKFFVVAMREAVNQRNAWSMVSLLVSFGMMLIHEAGQARMYWQNVDRYRKNVAKDFRLLDWEPITENLWGTQEMTLSNRQIEDVQTWSLPTLLRYEDRNSMGYGVESRLPFMDYRLMELALALPTRLKIRDGYGKWALRKLVAGSVPDFVRMNRKKRGFDVTQAWIKEGIGERLRSMIFDHRCVLSGHLRRGGNLDKLLSDQALATDSTLLNEALMLAWLAKPIRDYATTPAGTRFG